MQASNKGFFIHLSSVRSKFDKKPKYFHESTISELLLFVNKRRKPKKKKEQTIKVKYKNQN